MKIIRQRLRVTGRVQAVGFRYQACVAAKRYGVTGFVRNEYDGSVVMEVQGTYAQITAVMTELYQAPYIVIESVEKKILPVKEGDREFRAHYI